MKAKPIISYQCECAWILEHTPASDTLRCRNAKCPHFMKQYEFPVVDLKPAKA